MNIFFKENKCSRKKSNKVKEEKENLEDEETSPTSKDD